MNLRIKVYCVLLAVVYIAAFVSVMYDNAGDFKASFMEGYNASDNKSFDLFLDITRKGDTQPVETFYNEKANENIEVRVDNFHGLAKVEFKSIPTILFIARLLLMIPLVLTAGGLLAIPGLFYKIIRGVTKDKLLDSQLIMRVQFVGWILVAFCLSKAAYLGMDYIIAKLLIQISGYTITIPVIDYQLLGLGLIALLIAEILGLSLKLKEEQDLTI